MHFAGLRLFTEARHTITYFLCTFLFRLSRLLGRHVTPPSPGEVAFDHSAVLNYYDECQIVFRYDASCYRSALGGLGTVVRRVRVSQASSVVQSTVARSSGYRQDKRLQPAAVQPAETQTRRPDLTHLRLLGPCSRVGRARVVVARWNSHGPAVVSAHHVLSAATLLRSRYFIGVARGTCTPGRRKIFRRNLQGKFVSAPQYTKCTPRQSKSQFFIFLRDLEGGCGRFSSCFRPSFKGDEQKKM